MEADELVPLMRGGEYPSSPSPSRRGVRSSTPRNISSQSLWCAHVNPSCSSEIYPTPLAEQTLKWAQMPHSSRLKSFVSLKDSNLYVENITVDKKKTNGSELDPKLYKKYSERDER